MPPSPTTRRQLLAASALAGLIAAPAAARTIRGSLPWSQNEAYPPPIARPGPWQFFSPDEAATVAAICDRIVPADERGPGAGQCGGAVFIDRQLAGPYGRSEWLYMQGPFQAGVPGQGYQGEDPPAVQYRKGLAALARHTREGFDNKLFHQLAPEQQDRLLQQMERGEVPLEGADAKSFFELLLSNVMEGYFADPAYGGNQDMAGWKLVGFPGTRYDYRPVFDDLAARYNVPPVALVGRPEWSR